MADNTVLPTGTGGDTIASDDIGGVKFQRVKIVHGNDGVNAGDVSNTNPLPVEQRHRSPSYRLYVPAGAAGANKVYFDLFNATASGKTLRIKSVRAVKDGSVAVTGVLSVKLHLTRTSAIGTTGTAATVDGTSLTAPALAKMDPANAALPAGVTARQAPGGGATAGVVLGERHVFTEETSNAGYEHIEFMTMIPDVQPLIVPENTGIRVVQGAVASVGNIAFEVLFEAE